MADELQLERQIQSIEGLRNVIYSMRSLAATYLTRAERKLDGVRAYARTVGAGIADCLAGRDIEPPPAATGSVAVLAIFSEQGLCGRFNEILAEHARDLAGELDQPAFLTLGKRGPSLIRRHGLRLAEAFPSVSSPDDLDTVIHRAARLLIQQFEAGHFRQFYVLYAGYLSPGKIEPRHERILPLDLTPWRDAASAKQTPPRLHLPRLELLRRFVNEYAFVSLLRALAESLAAENGMRLQSMEGAKSNIDDTLNDLRQHARIARQNAITDELLDLIGGTEALRDT